MEFDYCTNNTNKTHQSIVVAQENEPTCLSVCKNRFTREYKCQEVVDYKLTCGPKEKQFKCPCPEWKQ